MVDEDRYWIDVLTQISAIQAALDKVALGLLDGHAAHFVAGAAEDERAEKTDELMAASGASCDAADRTPHGPARRPGQRFAAPASSVGRVTDPRPRAPARGTTRT